MPARLLAGDSIVRGMPHEPKHPVLLSRNPHVIPGPTAVTQLGTQAPRTRALASARVRACSPPRCLDQSASASQLVPCRWRSVAAYPEWVSEIGSVLGAHISRGRRGPASSRRNPVLPRRGPIFVCGEVKLGPLGNGNNKPVASGGIPCRNGLSPPHDEAFCMPFRPHFTAPSLSACAAKELWENSETTAWLSATNLGTRNFFFRS
ncbi:hypothetical protein B0T18DRAFT_21066 [Schizothecium vesticola]|uniref:Uncharacterized protein n=1 Tax=Schizothecium vesticola TaxID=314040 RepID=A0AA40F9M6_9PEZI|nr:hypothetical protein B0T18DRAFT_21066 [Schizothecium vesticola]